MSKKVQVKAATARDPDNVRETYANGPINVNIIGPCGTITFTNVRSDIADLLSGKPNAPVYASVVSRVTLPIDQLNELRTLLNRMIGDPPPAGSKLKQ